jgi:hypothetical protein
VSAPALIAKTRMIEHSLQCFVLGLLGLLPVIGFPLALFALMTFRRVCLEQQGHWNVARPYLLWGFVFGALGALVSLGLFFSVLLAILQSL